MATWFESVQPLALLGLAAFGALIAWQQKETARTKLQLDLFDRRFAVFDAARKFVGNTLAKGNATIESVREYYVATADADFLLDADVAKYLRELLDHVTALQAHNAMLEPGAPDNERPAAVAGKWDQMRWLAAQFEKRLLAEQFRPYLQFKPSLMQRALRRLFRPAALDGKKIPAKAKS